MFKKIIICCLLLVLAFSLRTESAHEQNMPTLNHNQILSQTNNKPGFNPTPGDPFGQNQQTKATCFSYPCYEPNWKCNGCWRTVIFAVPTNTPKLGRFVGYDCGRC